MVGRVSPYSLLHPSLSYFHPIPAQDLQWSSSKSWVREVSYLTRISCYLLSALPTWELEEIDNYHKSTLIYPEIYVTENILDIGEETEGREAFKREEIINLFIQLEDLLFQISGCVESVAVLLALGNSHAWRTRAAVRIHFRYCVLRGFSFIF